MRPPKKIYLVGFMGAGKTSVGRLLADRLDVPMVDLDEVIEAIAGSSVRTLFEREGEASFRQREREVLEGTLALDRAVVATGGGTFPIEANRELVRSTGLAIFLDVPFPTILARLKGKEENRPLFQDPTAAFRLYSERLEYYKLADMRVAVGPTENLDEIVARIALALPYGKV